MTGWEAIVIFLNAAVRQLHHLGRPVRHQVEGVIRARAARAFVVAAAAVLPVSAVVFVTSWLWLLFLGYRLLPDNTSAGHSVAIGSHPQVPAAAHHPNAPFAIKAQWLWAIVVLQRVPHPQRVVRVVVIGARGGQRLRAVALD